MPEESKELKEYIANEETYMITCPYCFNEHGKGERGYVRPFSHTQVAFRAKTYFEDMKEIERKYGKRAELEIMADGDAESKANLEKLARAEKYILREDENYNEFWKAYGGKTTEKVSRVNEALKPWLLPIIDMKNGVKKLIADTNGFVVGAIDEFGKETRQRICPYCHNPLPPGYGKNNVRHISIVGMVGSGKTVYISQLLKGMKEYVAKSGMDMFFTSEHETDFISDNRVEEGELLPESTPAQMLSQPMFCDVIRSDGMKNVTDTIVLHDIAGENCETFAKMADFAKYIEHSDGIIVLIDPKQLDIVRGSEDNISLNNNEEGGKKKDVTPDTVLNTLHLVLDNETGKKSKIPMAVCISKSDMCYEVLPEIAKEDVTIAGENETGMPRQEFDGRSYNHLSAGLVDIIKHKSLALASALQNNYINFNFFAVSAIGCKCEEKSLGQYVPVVKPQPRRIEEPILWMFKQFDYIESNERVKRPFPIQQLDKEIWKAKGPRILGIGEWVRVKGELSHYEEEVLREEIIREEK